MNHLVLFSIHPIFLFEFIFLGGIILKMKKFVIQWRKFEFKTSYFFKILIYEISRFFWILLEFILIFTDFNSFKKLQKGVIFPQEPRADVARRGTRGRATWAPT